MKKIFDGILNFTYRDFGWYEEDPDYLAEGGNKNCLVKLILSENVLPSSGRYRVKIKIEPIQESNLPNEE